MFFGFRPPVGRKPPDTGQMGQMVLGHIRYIRYRVGFRGGKTEMKNCLRKIAGSFSFPERFRLPPSRFATPFYIATYDPSFHPAPLPAPGRNRHHAGPPVLHRRRLGRMVPTPPAPVAYRFLCPGPVRRRDRDGPDASARPVGRRHARPNTFRYGTGCDRPDAHPYALGNMDLRQRLGKRQTPFQPVQHPGLVPVADPLSGRHIHRYAESLTPAPPKCTASQTQSNDVRRTRCRRCAPIRR